MARHLGRLLDALIVPVCLAAAVTTAPGQVCDGISTAPETPLTTVLVANGLTRPVFATAPPGDADRLFIVEQDGLIRILKGGALLPAPFLDLGAVTRSPADGGGNEQGLLGLAFHPGYASNGWFFVYHTTSAGTANVVERYSRSAADPNLADPSSVQTVITFLHPNYTNHNGGMIAFGPADGYLYIGTGDGGSSCDPSNNAQDGHSNLGKILRIDVDSLPYSIPAGNPFTGSADPLALVNDEIWALGLRNPWRFSFAGPGFTDPSDLYIGDVGQGAREEIDVLPGTDPGGANFGWDKYEGLACPNPSCGSANCVVPDYVPPVLDYDHSGGACSVTGGYVYGGCRMPGLTGTYFYADFCAAFIRSFVLSGLTPIDMRDRTAELAPAGGGNIGLITSFGRDARGEILILDRGATPGEGAMYAIVPILSHLEVSGPGAEPFAPGGASWAWEDLQATSRYPIASYRVYRGDTTGAGTFVCVHESTTPAWPGGDPAVPAAGEGYSYLVTALDATGEETTPGVTSAGSPRALSTAACP